MEKIQKMSVVLSFLAGIPLGISVCYLWLVALQPLLAIIVFIACISGVLGTCYLYARSNLRFRLHLSES